MCCTVSSFPWQLSFVSTRIVDMGDGVGGVAVKIPRFVDDDRPVFISSHISKKTQDTTGDVRSVLRELSREEDEAFEMLLVESLVWRKSDERALLPHHIVSTSGTIPSLDNTTRQPNPS